MQVAAIAVNYCPRCKRSSFFPFVLFFRLAPSPNARRIEGGEEEKALPRSQIRAGR